MATIQQTVQTLLDKIQGKQGAGELSGEETLLLSKAVQSLSDNQQFEQALIAVAEQHLDTATNSVNAASSLLEDVAQRVRSKDVGELIQTSQDKLGERTLLACDGSLPDFNLYPKLQTLLPKRLKLKSAINVPFSNLTVGGSNVHYRPRTICTVADGRKSFAADIYHNDDVYEITHDSKADKPSLISVIYTISDTPSSGDRYSVDICCSDDGQHIYVLSLTWNGSVASFAIYHSHNGGASFDKTDILGTPNWSGVASVHGYSTNALAKIQCSADGEKVELLLTPHNSVEQVFCIRSNNFAASFNQSRTPYGVLTQAGDVRCSYVSRSMNGAIVANTTEKAQGQVYFSSAAEQAFSDISAHMHYPILLNDSWFIISDDDSTLLHLSQSQSTTSGTVQWEYSRDNGQSFVPASTQLNVPQDTSEAKVGAVLFDPEDADYVYLAVLNITRSTNRVWAFYRLNIISGLNQCLANSVSLTPDYYTEDRWRFDVKRSDKQLAISFATGHNSNTMDCLTFDLDKFLPEVENTRMIAE